MTSLDFSEWPDLHQPHSCGTAPFVPDVSCERANSCGSYAAGFNCKYRPNCPDDLYMEHHGCNCGDGVLPTRDIVREGGRPPQLLRMLRIWPADGYGVPRTNRNVNNLLENFDFSGPQNDMLTNVVYIALIVGIVWLTTKR